MVLDTLLSALLRALLVRGLSLPQSVQKSNHLIMVNPRLCSSKPCDISCHALSVRVAAICTGTKGITLLVSIW